MKTTSVLLGGIAVLLFMAEMPQLPAPLVARENPLKNVRFWAYQIQKQNEGQNIQKLRDSHYDLLVIDQTRSLKAEEIYDSQTDVALLKDSRNSSGGKKIVICYLDVGEAENYRWYWKTEWKIGNPEWIVAEDPDGWSGNYPVLFWRNEWKAVMKLAVKGVIDDGYDGIYLDWLEVYSFKPVVAAAQKENRDPRQELINFVRELSLYAHSLKPDFLFIAQNAAELGDYPEYVRLFDAIAQEAIWYDGAGDPNTAEQPGDVRIDAKNSEEYIMNLMKWRQAGLPVFNVEYARNPWNARRAYLFGLIYGFKTYVTLRPLDSLTATPPPGY